MKKLSIKILSEVGCGKSTIATLIETMLKRRGFQVDVKDDEWATPEDRREWWEKVKNAAPDAVKEKVKIEIETVQVNRNAFQEDEVVNCDICGKPASFVSVDGTLKACDKHRLNVDIKDNEWAFKDVKERDQNFLKDKVCMVCGKPATYYAIGDLMDYETGKQTPFNCVSCEEHKECKNELA